MNACVNLVSPMSVSHETRRWIAEILLLGIPDDAIVAELQRRGWEAGLARTEVERASGDPYFQGAALLRQRVAKRDWILATIGRLAGMEGFGEIDRIDAPPASQFFRDYYCAHRPALISGLIDDWPALGLWSLDYFADRLGDPAVEVQTGRDGNRAYESQSYKHAQLMPLSRLLGMLRAGPETNDFYVTAKNGGHNRAALAPLWEDVGAIADYLDPDAGDDGYFWMGPKGTVTPFHHDLSNNLLVQIAGRKRVTLIPSWDTPKMLNHEHCFSDWDGPEALLALAEADRPAMLACTLQPGQALFIPVGWWHHVVGLDLTIAMSFTNFTRPNDFDRGYDCYGRL